MQEVVELLHQVPRRLAGNKVVFQHSALQDHRRLHRLPIPLLPCLEARIILQRSREASASANHKLRNKRNPFSNNSNPLVAYSVDLANSKHNSQISLRLHSNLLEGLFLEQGKLVGDVLCRKLSLILFSLVRKMPQQEALCSAIPLSNNHNSNHNSSLHSR